MSKLFGSPDGEAAGSQPTEQFWVGPGAGAAHTAGGGPGTGPAAGRVPGFGEHLTRDHRKARNWTIVLVAAALLAGGGLLALAGHHGQKQATLTASDQAAQLNSALDNAAAPGTLSTVLGTNALAAQPAPGGHQAGTAAGGPGGPLCARARRAARAAGHAGLPRVSRRLHDGAVRCRHIRHRVFRFLLLHGVAGQFTIQARSGLRTLAYERGVIESVTTGKSFVVKAADGTTWTWDLVSSTVVRDQQGKVSESNLSTGTPVWVGGPVTGGAKDARLIVLRPPVPASAAPFPTPSS